MRATNPRPWTGRPCRHRIKRQRAHAALQWHLRRCFEDEMTIDDALACWNDRPLYGAVRDFMAACRAGDVAALEHATAHGLDVS